MSKVAKEQFVSVSQKMKNETNDISDFCIKKNIMVIYIKRRVKNMPKCQAQ